MATAPTEILDFWYSERMQKHWFSSTPEVDQEILDKYESLWDQAAAGQLDLWCETPAGSLALVIVLDQLPLNMFRNQAKTFSTGDQAVRISRQAIDNKYNEQIEKDKVAFLFMPLMHSEDMDDQDLSVKMFTETGLDGFVKFADGHRDIVKRFGRFPHRNAILSRESTADELAYLASDEAFKG
jgi:uncharacterized protein (DUF924 family)